MMPRTYIQQQHRNTASRAWQSAHVRNGEDRPEPINWLLVALVFAALLAVAVALNIHEVIGGM